MKGVKNLHYYKIKASFETKVHEEINQEWMKKSNTYLLSLSKCLISNSGNIVILKLLRDSFVTCVTQDKWSGMIFDYMKRKLGIHTRTYEMLAKFKK